jgi:hypothetical protein
MANIDYEHSYHIDNYQAQQARLETREATQPFTLGPDAVYKKLLHAIEAKRAKPRYYVTFPTYLFGYLKRVLSTRMLDKLLVKSR